MIWPHVALRTNSSSCQGGFAAMDANKDLTTAERCPKYDKVRECSRCSIGEGLRKQDGVISKAEFASFKKAQRRSGFNRADPW